MMQFTIAGAPRTKKNGSRIVIQGCARRIIPSAAYLDYAESSLWQLRRANRPKEPIATPVNVRCIYFMPTARRVDLVNLLEATCDILVDAGILADDNSDIVASHDGSRVLIDRVRPRVEITITEATE